MVVLGCEACLKGLMVIGLSLKNLHAQGARWEIQEFVVIMPFCNDELLSRVEGRCPAVGQR